MSIRTRFAPSPTGYLHIGGARTALFAWLYAKKHNGEFILRIEDTDRERSTDAAVDAILTGMQWLGLTADAGPYFQTERMDRYKAVIQQLLDSGHAYYCHCSKERLEQLRTTQMANKQKPRYDGHCRELGLSALPGQSVIRFCNPLIGQVIVNDLIKGTVSFANQELDDLILARADGSPTYNLCVVVDDVDMAISHVIRGDDHLNNTPRQINILQALKCKLPEYAHVPMILGADGKRLSKRHGAVSVMQYAESGYLPQALLNYLVRLGWSHGDQEIFSIAEMIAKFELTEINSAAASFNPEKLLWLNQHYLKTLPVTELAKPLKQQFELAQLDYSHGPALTKLLTVQAERCKTLAEIVTESRYFYADFLEYDTKAAQKNLQAAATAPLTALQTELSAVTDWQADTLHQVIHNVAEQLELNLGKVAQPLRVAVAGSAVSPPIDVTLELLGKPRTLTRIQHALDYITKHAGELDTSLLP